MENAVEGPDEKWNRDITLMPHDKLVSAAFFWLIPARVRPNHFTVIRMLLTPVVVIFLWREMYSIAVPLFFLTAATDMIDGSLARVRRQITEWGIVYDPIADKLLIGSALFVIVLGHVNYVMGWAILAVEVVLVGGSILAQRRGGIRPSNKMGKIKMMAEVIGVTLLLIALWLDISLLVDLSNGTLVIALIVAILSLLPHLHK